MERNKWNRILKTRGKKREEKKKTRWTNEGTMTKMSEQGIRRKRMRVTIRKK